MTWNPTKDDCFPIVGEMCIVFDYFLYEVQLEFKPIQGFKARHWVRKYDKVGVSATMNEIRGKGNWVEFSSEDAHIVCNRVLLTMFEQIAAEATLSPIFEPSV